MSQELNRNTDRIDKWQEILDNMSDFPTCIKKGKRCFRYSKRGLRWRDDNSVIIQHIYPASQVGFASDKKTLKIAHNTYFIDDRRLDDNGSNSYLPAGARIGIDPSYIIEGIRQNIKEFGLPNMLFRHHGGGIEHLTMIPATINEMLMQSHEKVIRLFPCWDKTMDASFENLRADGAFLVSSVLTSGKIKSLKLKSLKGRTCIVENDDIKNIIIAETGKKIKFSKEGNYVKFKTTPDTEYVLI